MVEVIEQQPSDTVISYETLIHEAFIDPIRNVTVIDDEYPTLGQFLARQMEESDNIPELQLKPINIERLQKILALCHKEKNWAVDVFDGSRSIDDEKFIPPHLRHSDLVVLDYHLDGTANTDGSQARKIIELLECNNHFNMILVHTKGFDGGDIQQVFEEILCQFHQKIDLNNSIFTISAETEEKIETWLSENNDGVDFSFFSQKMSVMDVINHLKFNTDEIININFSNHFLYRFKNEVNSASRNISINKKEMIKWYISQEIKRVQSNFKKTNNEKVAWHWDNSTKVNYISTGRVFISVIKKEDREPQIELINSLKNALVQLNPSPMHLLMARMRYCIDEKGLEQANKIISNREAQAGWLYKLITKGNDNTLEHDIVINAHWEQLIRATKDELRLFSQRAIEAASFRSPSEIINSTHARDIVKHFFCGCMEADDITLGFLNAFTCSQPLIGNHLTTGTIFQLEGKYWVCLSPACDLVPRTRRHWENRIGNEFLAFKAVELKPLCNLKEANKNANYNNYIYLLLDGNPTAFSFPTEKENPIWDTFYAANQGRFDDNGLFKLTCLRKEDLNEVTSESIAQENTEVIFELKSVIHQAKAIAELRYEYALNFLHKFGASQTRVGLGFTDTKNFI